MTFTNTQYYPQNKVEGKFYPLQTQENARACRELTKAQLAVLYHIKTVDPFGDRLIELDMCEVAHLLGLSKLTVYRALLLLNRLGWIYLGKTITVVSSQPNTEDKYNNPDIKCVSMCNLMSLSDISMSLSDLNNSEPDLNNSEPDLNNSEPDLNNSEPDLNNSEPDTDMSGLNLKPLPDKGFKSSQTNKTNKTNKTLSRSENEKPKTEREIGKKDQEKFRKFANSKMEQLPKYPVLPKRWIVMHFEELWAEYEELEGRREENEERIGKSIEESQDTGLDPIIAAGLAAGKILKLDPIYKGLWDAENIWHHQSEWIEAEKRRLAES